MATAADADDLSASVVSPSQHQSDAIIQQLDQGRHCRHQHLITSITYRQISSSSSSSSSSSVADAGAML